VDVQPNVSKVGAIRALAFQNWNR